MLTIAMYFALPVYFAVVLIITVWLQAIYDDTKNIILKFCIILADIAVFLIPMIGLFAVSDDEFYKKIICISALFAAAVLTGRCRILLGTVNVIIIFSITLAHCVYTVIAL